MATIRAAIKRAAMKSDKAGGCGVYMRLLLAVALCGAFAPAAFSNSAPLGELLAARGASVDDSIASPGLTLLQGSRVKTSAQGGAVLNLGRLGRVTLGPESELVLESSGNSLSGRLNSGWMIVSSPRGVGVAIKTADGFASADGAEASTLRIDVTQETTRVEAAGIASVQSGAMRQMVRAGEELEISRAATGALPEFSRYTVDSGLAAAAAAAAERAAAASFSAALSTGVRAAFESITLDQTIAPAPTMSNTLKPVSGDTPIITTPSQEITCGDFNENCVDCQVFPQLVKAKAGCTLAFIVHLQNVLATSQVSVGPFMNGACFYIFPGAPQVVQIPPGGSYYFQINANNCTVAQTRSAANALIVIETNTCGTKYVQVEWATPCR
ncbi:MAG: hypothetical protein KIT57_17485 [Blastocatellales bacterium]|nr:hypothetical protein [Blastocatellales bacterium]